MVAHPGRRNLDNRIFLDFDDILVLMPVPIDYPDLQNPRLLRAGWAVDGFTKGGLRLSSLLGEFIFKDVSGTTKPDTCINFINEYWLTK